MPWLSMPPRLDAPTWRMRAAQTLARKHRATDVVALKHGAIGALWRGAPGDAVMLRCAAAVRPALQKPMALIDAACGAPPVWPGAPAVPFISGPWGPTSLVGLSVGLGLKCVCLCLATAWMLGAQGLGAARMLWAQLRGDVDAQASELWLRRALGEMGAADVLGVIAVFTACGDLDDRRAGAGASHALWHKLGQALAAGAGPLSRLVAHLCQHPEASMRLWRLSHLCRSIPQDPLGHGVWAGLGQLGLQAAARTELLEWASLLFATWAQSAAAADDLGSVVAHKASGEASALSFAPMLEALLGQLAAGLCGETCAVDGSGLQAMLVAWLEAHADDATVQVLRTYGLQVWAQCRRDILAHLEAEQQTLSMHLASWQARCPEALWTCLGAVLQVLVRAESCATPTQRRAEAASEDAWGEDGTAGMAEAAWIARLVDARMAPLWRSLAEAADVLHKLEALGRRVATALPGEAAHGPWTQLRAVLQTARRKPASLRAKPGADAADDVDAVDDDAMRCDPGTAPSPPSEPAVQPAPAGCTPKTSRLSVVFGMPAVWRAETTTVVERAEVRAYYQALRTAHAARVGLLDAAATGDVAGAAAPEAHVDLCLALGHVLETRTQAVCEPYRTSGRLNMRRYMQARLRPTQGCAPSATYYDKRDVRPVRSRALRFGIVAPGTLALSGQTPWRLFCDVVDGQRRTPHAWRRLGYLFVVLESLFATSEAEWGGFAHLLAPLGAHLLLPKRPQDGWDTLWQNQGPMNAMPEAAASSRLAEQLAGYVQQARPKPRRDINRHHKAQAHEVGVWLMTPEQAPAVWAHLNVLRERFPYFSAVGVVMGAAPDLPTTVRDAFVIVETPDADLTEIADRVGAAFAQLQSADADWDMGCTTG